MILVLRELNIQNFTRKGSPNFTIVILNDMETI